jgi:circadian clock protein KaiB
VRPADTTTPSPGGEAVFRLRLYVTDRTPASQRAVDNLRSACQEYPDDRYEVEVIDLLTDPDRAREDQIIAVPTLIRELPEPIRRIIGDLSDQGEMLVELLMIPRDVAR